MKFIGIDKEGLTVYEDDDKVTKGNGAYKAQPIQPRYSNEKEDYHECK